MNRRDFLKVVGMGSVLPVIVESGCCRTAASRTTAARPNILFCISDDQSWLHTGAYGDPVVKTPHFDRVAKEGVLFTHAFCAAPSCTPSRAAALTGQDIWRLGEGATLRGVLHKAKYKVYPSLLEQAGYRVGYTGKGWAPGDAKAGGWGDQNPAGKAYNSKTATPPAAGIVKTDYAANFEVFLNQRKDGQPFCFWFGPSEPHRDYEYGIGLKSGKRIEDVRVPGWLPDAPQVRSDILDYYYEIEWADTHLGRMLKTLEDKGELENTLVVVTSDNGMPFPRAKASLYDSGVRMPLAICWPSRVKGGRVVDDMVSLTDLAPTFLEAAKLHIPPKITGRSLMDILLSDKSGRVNPQRDSIVTAFERHTLCRPDGVSYPMRAIRTHRWLYIHNIQPDRWPAGDPEQFGDCDNSPTKTYILEHRNDPEVASFFNRAFGKRPAEELYDVVNDPAQLHNLAHDPAVAGDKTALRERLEQYLQNTAPRHLQS